MIRSNEVHRLKKTWLIIKKKFALQGLSPSQLSPPSHGYSVAEANSSGAGGANGAGGSSTGRGGAAGAGVASTGAAGGGAGAGGGTSGGIITLSSTNSLLVNGYRFSGGGVTSTTGNNCLCKDPL